MMTESNESPLDEIIRQAQEAGAFDHLPGKGKPIAWEDDSSVPEEQRLANRVLRSHGFTADWIALAQELDTLYAQALRVYHTQCHTNPALQAQALAQFQARVRALNLRLVGYHLRAPAQAAKAPYPLEPK